MSNITYRGMYLFAKWIFLDGSVPANFYAALVTGATAPSATINTLGQLHEIPNGNGYTSGGQILNHSAIDFLNLVEDDSSGFGSIDVKDLTWTAAGGNLPASGDPIRYMVITTNEGTIADRQVIAWHDFTGNITATINQEIICSAGKFKFSAS